MSDKLPLYEEVTVKLPRAVLEFFDLMVADTCASRADVAGFLIRSEFHRFLIGSKLEQYGFTDYERVLDITPFLPVPEAVLKPAMEYIDQLASAKCTIEDKEVSSDD